MQVEAREGGFSLARLEELLAELLENEPSAVVSYVRKAVSVTFQVQLDGLPQPICSPPGLASIIPSMGQPLFDLPFRGPDGFVGSCPSFPSGQEGSAASGKDITTEEERTGGSSADEELPSQVGSAEGSDSKEKKVAFVSLNPEAPAFCIDLVVSKEDAKHGPICCILCAPGQPSSLVELLAVLRLWLITRLKHIRVNFGAYGYPASSLGSFCQVFSQDFFIPGLSLQILRVGEAQNPGPSFWVGTSNPSGISNKEFVYAQLPHGVWGISETHLTRLGQKRTRSRFQQLTFSNSTSLSCQFGAPVEPRARSTTSRTWSGVVMMVGAAHFRPLRLHWPQDEYCLGRAQLTEVWIGAFSILCANVYGWAKSPTWPSAHRYTSAMLDAITKEVVLSRNGPRMILGDMNLQKEDTCHFEIWRAHGWVEVQSWAAVHLQRPITMTPKGSTQLDYVWLSPELVPLLKQVRTWDGGPLYCGCRIGRSAHPIHGANLAPSCLCTLDGGELQYMAPYFFSSPQYSAEYRHPMVPILVFPMRKALQATSLLQMGNYPQHALVVVTLWHPGPFDLLDQEKYINPQIFWGALCNAGFYNSADYKASRNVITLRRWATSGQ